jgi:hypothetical protein
VWGFTPRGRARRAGCSRVGPRGGASQRRTVGPRWRDQPTGVSLSITSGRYRFNGDGTGLDFVTFSVNGVDQQVPSPVAITYTLNHDCTGTYSVENGPHFDIFAAVDGSQLSVTATDSGHALAEGPSLRVGFGR